MDRPRRRGYERAQRPARRAPDDPDPGHSKSTWTGFGDLESRQVDADKQLEDIWSGHTLLGRVQETATADGVRPTNGIRLRRIGQLAKSTSPDKVECAYSYDGAGRVSSETWTLNTGIAGVDGTTDRHEPWTRLGRLLGIAYRQVAVRNPVFVTGRHTAQRRHRGALSPVTATPPGTCTPGTCAASWKATESNGQRH